MCMVVTKTIRIDANAHKILVGVKGKMMSEGISNPTLSDAIRWLDRQVEDGSGKS